MKRALLGLGMITVVVALGVRPAHAEPITNPRPATQAYLRIPDSYVCQTYDDGGGMCGRAHLEDEEWIFDTVEERHCLIGYRCETLAPELWGDR